MKFLVKGSIPERAEGQSETDYERLRKEYEGVCKALGAAIARKKHTIMVGVPDWSQLRLGRTVANYIIKGASEVPDMGEHKIIFYAPQEPEPPDTTADVADTLRELDHLPNIDIDERFLGRGPWSAAMIPDVNEADVVILIGGGEGTATIGYAAYSLNRPVVAITYFGGAARDISENLLFGDYIRYQERYGIVAEELRSLQVEWFAEDGSPDALETNRSNADSVVILSEKLIRKFREASIRARTILTTTMGYLVAFMGLWLVVFLYPNLISTRVAFFVLLFLSAVLGTGLRTLVSYQEGRIAQLTLVDLGIDVTIALIVAFGLALVYFVGGISFTGSIVVLDSAADSKFASIAISMSLLGLAAGYLVPLKQLQENLEKFIAPQDTEQQTQVAK